MAETFEYRPQNVCSRLIKITIEGDTVAKVEFVGGCRGNTQGVAALCKGDPAVEDAELRRIEARGRGAEDQRLDQIGMRDRDGTSCPDQLAQGLKKIKAEKGI